jgi:hypothetical protein
MVNDAGFNSLLALLLLVDDLRVLLTWIILCDMIVFMVIFVDAMVMQLSWLVDGCHKIDVATWMLLLRLMTCGW